MSRSSVLVVPIKRLTTQVDQADPSTRERHAGSAPLLEFFMRNGTLVRLTRHQQIAPDAGQIPFCFLVRVGAIALEAALPQRHIVGFWHEGDLLTPAHVIPLPRLSIRAVRSSELWRVRDHGATGGLPPDLLHHYLYLSTLTLRRIMVSATMLASLTAEQRVVSFLISCALRFGKRTGNRAEIDTPLSRPDVADHLSVNPDTLSRTMTRLQDLGLVETIGRRELIIRDWRGVCARTPLSPELLG